MTTKRTTRAYHSPVREQRAQQTRQRVLEAAADSFSARGYAGTTLAKVAADAGVSLDSVVAVGSKAFLLLESFRRRYAGDGGWRSLLDHPAVQQMFAIDDRDEALDAVVDFLAEGHAASAQLWYVVRSTALVEPVVAEGLDELIQLKEESFAATADWLVAAGVLAGVDAADRQALSMHVNLLMSAETYVTLTRDWHLTEAEYRAWLRRHLPLLRP